MNNANFYCNESLKASDDYNELVDYADTYFPIYKPLNVCSFNDETNRLFCKDKTNKQLKKFGVFAVIFGSFLTLAFVFITNIIIINSVQMICYNNIIYFCIHMVKVSLHLLII